MSGLFEEPDHATPLSPEERAGLKLAHITMLTDLEGRDNLRKVGLGPNSTRCLPPRPLADPLYQSILVDLG